MTSIKKILIYKYIIFKTKLLIHLCYEFKKRSNTNYFDIDIKKQTIFKNNNLIIFHEVFW